MANGNGFNVFDYVDELKEAGLPDKQADIFARAFHDMASASAATKQDLDITKLELKRDIADLKRDIKSLDVKIETIKSDLSRDMKASQATQTLQILGGMAALIVIFGFAANMINNSQ